MLNLLVNKNKKMDFKELLYLALSATLGGTLNVLRSKYNLDAKKIAVKLLSAIVVGVVIMPAAMEHFDFSFRFWIAITAIASMVAEPILDILTDKIQEKLKKDM
jgi:hypothetical protein